MNRDDANEIKHLLHYEEDTAGYERYYDDGIYLIRCQYSGLKLSSSIGISMVNIS